MWRTVVDTKQGKVWANLPIDSKMMLVADVEDNAADYLMWNKIIGSIREADANKIEVFGKLIEKKFEETIDENIKPSYTINSDRGNPSDL